MPAKSAIVKKVIKKYGAVINLNEHPEVLDEIIRNLGAMPEDGPTCGGTPPSPAPPPGRLRTVEVLNEDIMKAVLNVARDVAQIKASLASTRKR